jgi:hypothetical protein
MMIPQGHIVMRQQYEKDMAELRKQIEELRQMLEQPEKRPYIKRAEKWMKDGLPQS